MRDEAARLGERGLDVVKKILWRSGKIQ